MEEKKKKTETVYSKSDCREMDYCGVISLFNRE